MLSIFISIEDKGRRVKGKVLNLKKLGTFEK